MDSPTLSESTSTGESWSIFARNIQKEQIIYFTQIFIVYTVIIAAIINLALSETPCSIWGTILSGTVGYILPAPKIRKKKNGPLLPNPA
jgi:lipoprotein signal peptidase